MLLKKKDYKIFNLIKKEKNRQNNQINLIASENYVSTEVLKAQGSILTNKYAEGYPKKRYYAGCKYIDLIEEIAIKRAKKLFQCDYANVQPHSGSQANYAIYSALLKAGDTILGMNLSDGGHLTHGSKINFSGKLYNCISYGVNYKEYINYNQIEKLAKKYTPKIIIGGFSAYSRIINWKKLRKIADKINAYLFVDMSHISGLVVAGIYPNPINYAHIVSTTTHKTLAGPRGGLILAKNGTKKFYKKIDSSIFPGSQGGPLMHIIAAKAIAFKEALNPSFKKYQKKTVKFSKIMAKIFSKFNFKIISKKTENHLFLIDLHNKNLNGLQAEKILENVNIIVNKNTIPNDKNKPNICSGIRIGTPAITRRKFKKKDVKKLTKLMCKILNTKNNTNLVSYIKNKIKKICKKYPINL